MFSGLPTVTLSHVVRELVTSDRPLSGLYNVASEPIAKYDLLVRLNEAFGLEYQIDPDPTFVIDRSLDDLAFRAATGTVRPAWDDLVRILVDDYRSLPYDTIYRRLRENDT